MPVSLHEMSLVALSDVIGKSRLNDDLSALSGEERDILGYF